MSMKNVGKQTDPVIYQYAKSMREALGPMCPGVTQACLAGWTATAFVTIRRHV